MDSSRIARGRKYPKGQLLEQAGVHPALRAARVDPMVALRQD
jgi:hypothetical protein